MGYVNGVVVSVEGMLMYVGGVMCLCHLLLEAVLLERLLVGMIVMGERALGYHHVLRERLRCRIWWQRCHEYIHVFKLFRFIGDAHRGAEPTEYETVVHTRAHNPSHSE